MNEDLINLGKRATACAGWFWMPGMLTTEYRRVVRVMHDDLCDSDDVLYLFYADEDKVFNAWADEQVPCFTDAPTMGCLLEIVRAAYGRASGQARRWSVDGWYWHADYDDQNVSGKRLYTTEAEALVAALEAAP